MRYLGRNEYTALRLTLARIEIHVPPVAHHASLSCPAFATEGGGPRTPPVPCVHVTRRSALQQACSLQPCGRRRYRCRKREAHYRHRHSAWVRPNPSYHTHAHGPPPIARRAQSKTGNRIDKGKSSAAAQAGCHHLSPLPKFSCASLSLRTPYLARANRRRVPAACLLAREEDLACDRLIICSRPSSRGSKSLAMAR